MRQHTSLLVLVLCIHLLLLAHAANRLSPVFSEIGHLPAGLSHWKFGMFDLYRVNPPLPRMVAALPILLAAHEEQWTKYNNNPTGRSEILIGRNFLSANGSNSFWLYTLGRWACLPFSVVGMLTCYFWARDMFGNNSGLLAAILWCFSPTMLGHGALIMPDVPAAALGLLAGYTFWIWLKSPSGSMAILCGVTLGLAELTKFTLLVFYPVFFALWLIHRLSAKKSEGRLQFPQFRQFCLVIAVSLFVINMGYGFAGSAKRLQEFTFLSRVLTGEDDSEHRKSGNRFVGTPLGTIPVPIPEDYLQGLDRQKADFDSPTWSYLRGQWQDGGWWYFYAYAFAIKTPIGTLLLCCLSIVLFRWPAYRSDLTSELCVIAPAIAIFCLVSSQTTFSIHPRYTLPALPFLFILVSRVARSFRWRATASASITTICVIWSAGSSLYYYPHSLSYFNAFVGGPKNGHHHLLDSGVAWGQDLLFLKEWYDNHPEARPFHVASFGWTDPQLAGISYVVPPLAPVKPGMYGAETIDKLGPKPGWFAIDVNHLRGTIWDAPTGNGGWRHFWMDFGKPIPNFTYFQRFEPVDRVAYSYVIYHVSLSDANRVRQELGLPKLVESISATDDQKTSTSTQPRSPSAIQPGANRKNHEISGSCVTGSEFCGGSKHPHVPPAGSAHTFGQLKHFADNGSAATDIEFRQFQEWED